MGFILGTIYIICGYGLYSWLFLVLYFEKQGMEYTFRSGLKYSLLSVYFLASLLFVSQFVMFLGVSNYQKNALLLSQTIIFPQSMNLSQSKETQDSIHTFSKQCFQSNQKGNLISGFFQTNTKDFFYLDGVS